MKKATMATIKSFIKREFAYAGSNLYIKQKSNFDGMVDCVMPVEDSFKKVESVDFEDRNKLGIVGAWFVGSSRDYISEYADSDFIGYEIYNCCGSFILAMKRLYKSN